MEVFGQPNCQATKWNGAEYRNSKSNCNFSYWHSIGSDLYFSFVVRKNTSPWHPNPKKANSKEVKEVNYLGDEFALFLLVFCFLVPVIFFCYLLKRKIIGRYQILARRQKEQEEFE
jgi:hypothetical protein